MRKTFAITAAALTLAGALAAGSPAAAQHRRDRDNDHGDAVAAGVLGFALGAAVAGNSNAQYRSNGYYAPQRRYNRSERYYGEPRGYASGYGYRPARRCVVEQRWDRRWGRYVSYERCW